jgi:stearoyl-CoA desaturase (delta-9 desaturase)
VTPTTTTPGHAAIEAPGQRRERQPLITPDTRTVQSHAGMVTGMLAVHGLASLAPWTFTAAGLATAVVLHVLTGPLGIGLGYHRLLCHKSFHTVRWLRYVFVLLGVLAFQKGPLSWCVIHRLHHRYSDTDLDPQMSGGGFLLAHILWAVSDQTMNLGTERAVCRVARDLHHEAVLRWLERNLVAVNILFVAVLFQVGWLIDGAALATSLVIWGFFLRVVFGWHVTFLVNSINHRWGYRNHASPDNSRNCWWVALLTFGEGWHNNHHHRPRCATHGHRWFEIDLAYAVIRLLERLGLVHAVIHPPRQMQRAKAGGAV